MIEKSQLIHILNLNRMIYFYPQGIDVVSSSPIKFDEFVLDGARYELLRAGRSIKLEKIPMELLILLVARNGNLVTRQEIIEHLWGKDVFVDTEHGINTAVRKIRQALKDDPDEPRYIQTVTGKGYRFLAERQNGNAAAAVLLQEPQSTAVAKAEEAAKVVPPNRSGWRWIATAAIGICLIAAIVLGFDIGGLRDRIFASNQIGPIHAIAVLPITNLSGDSSQEYFADGMTDELITALAQNHSLRVVSRTSAMQYKGVNKPLREIAQALGVDGILEGSIMRSNGQVHVNLQLIYAPTDTHVWAQSYDRNLNDAISLPEEISQIIATEAKVNAVSLKPQHPVNSQAHDAYLQGRYFWFEGNYQRSREYFEKAIQQQSDYALAWSGLADSYAADAVSGASSPQESFAKCEAAARKGLELDDSIPEVHNSMAGVLLFSKWDWKQAEAESLRSIELNPNYSEGHYMHSYILTVLNRDDKALQEQKRSTEIDPFHEPEGLGELYMGQRHYDAAIKEFRLQVDAQPNNAGLLFDLSGTYWLNRYVEGIRTGIRKSISRDGG